MDSQRVLRVVVPLIAAASALGVVVYVALKVHRGVPTPADSPGTLTHGDSTRQILGGAVMIVIFAMLFWLLRSTSGKK